MAYTKNIAVIRELKSGFSADGGALTGLVKVERYGAKLKAEASLINFAPLTEGRYVIAVSDGKHTQILDGSLFEGFSELDPSAGFAALVCFVNGEVSPIASAVCGAFSSAALGIRAEIEKAERVAVVAEADGEKQNTLPKDTAYEDEALAEENYYEFEQTDKDGGTVCEDKEKAENGRKSSENEAAVGAVAGKKLKGGHAHGMCFFERMKTEIEGLLAQYPADNALENTVENSRWVRIAYGDGKFYVFGVIYGVENGAPQYICYGVPSKQSKRPPDSLAGLASFIPASPEGGDGYWVMYQDAATGASVKIESE